MGGAFAAVPHLRIAERGGVVVAVVTGDWPLSFWRDRAFAAATAAWPASFCAQPPHSHLAPPVLPVRAGGV
jgi:hypothetical protein